MPYFRRFVFVGAGALATLLHGETPPGAVNPASASAAVAQPATSDLEMLRKKIADQENQIKKLQEAVQEQRAILERAVTSINAAAPASSPALTNGANTANASNSSSSPLIYEPAVGRRGWNVARGAGQNLQAEPKQSPLSIPIGTATFTPLGFVDFTWYGRSTNVGSGIGSNFGGIPYNTTATGHLSENNFTAQNSRIGFRVDSKVLGAKVLGYFEADFLGNQPTNLFVTSNADTFRMRNVFADVVWHKWEVLGGQDWSMMTPNRKGISPIPGDIFFTQNMDTNYQAGLIWSRQAQFRLLYHPTKDFVFGFGLENPQQYIGGSGGLGGNTVALPAALANTLLTQFNNNGTIVNNVTGGQNYGVPNLHPDIVFKAAYDGHVGKNDKIYHVEASSLIRSFKDTIPTTTQPIKYNSNTATGVSGSVNANLEVVKNFKIIANTFFGQGGGRYIFGLAPDVIIRADGSISPIHAFSTVDGVELTVHKNTLLDAYYGGAFIGRNVALDNPAANGVRPLIGYGYRGSPNGDNRSIQEVTFGVTQTFWKSERYGALALINQYSWLNRNPWYVAIGAPKAAHTNLYYINLRYTIP